MAKRKMRVLWVPVGSSGALLFWRAKSDLPSTTDDKAEYVRFVESPPKKARKKR